MWSSEKISVAIRVVTLSLILLSISITYYVTVIKKDYEVFTNPDGPETDDYFEELGVAS